MILILNSIQNYLLKYREILLNFIRTLISIALITLILHIFYFQGNSDFYPVPHTCQQSLKKPPQKVAYLWQLGVFFLCSPELHFRFINSFIQPSLVGSLGQS